MDHVFLLPTASIQNESPTRLPIASDANSQSCLPMP